MPELSQLLSAALILMMFAMGLGLSVKNFLGLSRQPALLLTTIAGQLLLLPLLALAIGYAVGASPAIAVGLLLVALCPSGSTSNFFTKLGLGNAALSVSLTAIISTISVFSLPLILLTAAPLLGYRGGEMSLSLAETVKDVALHTLLPVVAGMTLNTLFGDACRKLEPAVVALSSAAFFAVIALLWWQNWDNIVGSFMQAGLATLLLLAASLALGSTLGFIIGAAPGDRFTMMLEVGVQNGALAFFIAVNLLDDMTLLAPATVYTVTMVLAALPLVWWRRWRLAAPQSDTAASNVSVQDPH